MPPTVGDREDNAMDEQTERNAQEGLSSALDSIFSDPAARERFEAMVKSFRENLSESAPASSSRTPGEDSADGLAAVLSNPTLMANLPGLLSGMKLPSAAPPHEKTADARRRDLLLALKPFLSKSRGDAVDMILQISRLGTVLRMMR